MIPLRRLRIALLALATASCSGGDANVLHLYTSLDAQEAPLYIEAFEQETGIDVEFVRLSAGEALARLEAEKGNPQVSAWFGGPSPEYIVAAQRGLLEPFSPELDYELPVDAHGAAREWTGFYRGVIGFACNTEFLARVQATCPQTWQELLDPRFDDHISMAYPYTSGTAYVLLVGLLSLMGEERGWEYVRRLDAQVHRYNSSGTAAVTQVGMGEAGIGIAFAHDILQKGVTRGYPVTLSVPRDGTAPEIGGAAVVKGGPTPELAQRFVTWLLSERAQSLLTQFHRTPLHPRVSPGDNALPHEVNVVQYDAAQAAAQQPRLLEQWREITGR